MPILNIDMFDETPSVGDKVRVTGKIQSIDEENGEVDVSYDKVTIVNNKKRSRKDDDDVEVETTEEEMMPNTQTLDDALARSFDTTQ